MNLLIICEAIAILFVYPILLGMLLRRGIVIGEKQAAFTLATLLSLFVGSGYISLGKPETVLSVPSKDWLVAIPLSLLVWVCLYPLCRLLYKGVIQR